MGLSFEISTLILLFAPLFLPKLFSVAGRLLTSSTRGPGSQKGTSGSSTSAPRAATTSSRPFLPSIDYQNALAVALAVYSLLSLVYFKPFNLFTSLGGLPVTAPAGQIQVALSRHGLLDKYGDDLSLLTSLDRRILYLHYGHANFVGCQQLLGSTAPRDLLAYSSIRIVQSAMGKGLLLGLSNRRWKISLFIASVAGALYNIYVLATTGPQLASADATYLTLSHLSSYWSNLGFLLLSISALLLPSKRPERSLSPDEAILLQATQALVQRQDMIQTRIRVIEAATSLTTSRRINKEIDSQRTSSLGTEERQSLRTWLQAIVSSRMHPAAESMTSSAPIRDLPAVSTALAPTHAVPINQNVPAISSNQLQLPKSSSMQTVDDASFATAQVVATGTSDDEEDDLRSPSLSRSSSMSSHIDTPTPAMRRPMSLDLTAAGARIAQKLGEDASAEFDQPLGRKTMHSENPVRLTQSLGPSGPAKHPNLLPETGMLQDIFPGASTSSSQATAQQSSVTGTITSSEELSHNPGDDAIIVSAEHPPAEAAFDSIHSSTLPPGQQEEKQTDTRGLSNKAPVHSTPSFPIANEDGWTTVLSKKTKFKT